MKKSMYLVARKMSAVYMQGQDVEGGSQTGSDRSRAKQLGHVQPV